jgi:methionyl-tRNA synthetase
LRFQAQIFQSFLSALGHKNTDKILVHGTILDSYGRKMSKSEGNVIDPFEQLEKYGINAVRYYSLAGLNTTENSNWDEDVLIQLYNSHVCNDWGNLISRVLHLIDTKTDSSKITGENITEHFNSLFSIYKLQDEISDSWERLSIKEALEKTNQLIKVGNKYINDEKPWALEDCSEVLNNLYYIIKFVGNIYKSVFPNVDIDTVISNKKKVILFEKIK